MTEDTHGDMEIDTNVSVTKAAKRKAPEPKPKIIHFTSRNPPWTYLKLKLVSQPGSAPQPLDALSARTYLSSALSQFLGLTGTAIPIDILKIEDGSPSTTKYHIMWIRVPREDASAVVSAVSSWIGGGNNSASSGDVAWRVCAKGNFLGALVAGSGADLFVP
ncbi:uncharacterized protein N7518_000341 [Penicillium psychrosexuale]|uniref:uncharacterized protein n=1 Tax=Penicillium psychrosexuale TaxID=1002107 RepID=UPI0025456FE3|nr:uncharacterized protein N7518_000341 [Penicillium psychrosexuale]KAJ5804038.1 hypothetical protein N7518_000341 [Penicillium psychrosexuale]